MFKIKFCNFEYGEKIRRLFYTIESVVETDKNIIINVKESSPAPNMVTQGITYPFCVVKINSKKKLLLKKMPLFLVAFFV
jgi:hypothetical protein